jgi:predicted HAD superfamily Cof-like phosphohydrolase
MFWRPGSGSIIFSQKYTKMANEITLHQLIGHVEKFHTSFGIANNDSPTEQLTDDEILLRYKLMREENEEYLEAAQKGDIVEIADALGDQLYILCGTILKHGLQHKMEEVFEEIQRSNMSKLDSEGKPIYREDGKVLKSDQYFRPDIKAILEVEEV